jgi:hypothetical protein
MRGSGASAPMRSGLCFGDKGLRQSGPLERIALPSAPSAATREPSCQQFVLQVPVRFRRRALSQSAYMSSGEPLALGRDPTAIRARLEITWRGPVDHDAKPAGTTLSPDFAGCVTRTSSPAMSASRPAWSAVSPAATTAPCIRRFIAVVDPTGTVRACHKLRNSEVIPAQSEHLRRPQRHQIPCRLATLSAVKACREALAA